MKTTLDWIDKEAILKLKALTDQIDSRYGEDPEANFYIAQLGGQLTSQIPDMRTITAVLATMLQIAAETGLEAFEEHEEDLLISGEFVTTQKGTIN